MLGIVNFSKEKFPKFQGRVILSTENVLNFVTLPQERNCSVMNIAELWKIYTPDADICERFSRKEYDSLLLRPKLPKSL